MTELSPEMARRYGRLTDRATSLRGRTSTDRSRLLFVIGGLAMSLGLSLVVLGYIGASRTIYVFEQIPYLVSGGILGGCLVVAGGFSYFAFWLTRIHNELTTSRANSQRTVDALQNVERLLEQLIEVQTPGRKKAS
jgi:hypothetical protein